MARVLACGYGGEGISRVAGNWADYVVLIEGTRSPPAFDIRAAMKHSVTKALILTFDDTNDPNAPGAPRPEHIQRLVAFVDEARNGDHVLILCPGGYGRSSAAAIIALVALDAPPAAALEQTVTDLPHATPNRLMIALADNELGCDGSLWSVVRDFWEDTLGIASPPPIPTSRAHAATRRRRRRRGRAL